MEKKCSGCGVLCTAKYGQSLVGLTLTYWQQNHTGLVGSGPAASDRPMVSSVSVSSLISLTSTVVRLGDHPVVGLELDVPLTVCVSFTDMFYETPVA